MSILTLSVATPAGISPPGGQALTVFNTFIHPSAQQRVADLLASTFLSEGKLVREFEARLHQELGMVHPAALNSGTSALHLALEVAGVGPGDEVILNAAHAPGATYGGQAIGAISDFTCFSFRAIKHLTIGDGRALCARPPSAPGRCSEAVGSSLTEPTPRFRNWASASITS